MTSATGTLRHQAALAFSALAWPFSSRLRRSIVSRISRALSSAAAPVEVRRLARAAAGYAALARADHSAPGALRLPPVPSIPPSSLLVTVPVPHASALRIWFSRLPSGVELLVLPAPAVQPQGIDRHAADRISAAPHSDTPLFGLKFFRAGLTSFRADLLPLAKPGHETPDGGIIDRVSLFLDDLLRENPAQYDWLAPRRQEKPSAP